MQEAAETRRAATSSTSRTSRRRASSRTTWSSRPDQVEAIATADVVLYLGDGFQPAVEDAMGDAEGVTVDLLAGLPTVGASRRE